MTVASRVALVTGGSGGIGREICKDLALAGFTVVINYATNKEAATQVLRDIDGLGQLAMLAECDVTDLSDVRNMFKMIAEKFGRLDVLVNNAGIVHENLFSLTKLEDFWNVVTVNLGGVLHCCKCAIPLMVRRRQGRIINISSIASMHGTAGLSAYATSKAAINSLSNVLARELAPAGISVNVVAPGLIDTAMPAGMKSPAARQRAIELQPVARLGSPTEVASVVTYLADRAPQFLTGELIRIDGGAMIG